MKERPILFSGPMVRAILEGRKTQTRRVVKGLPPDAFELGHWDKQGDPGRADSGLYWHEPDGDSFATKMMPCPYGQPGDRLWVRETFALECGGEDYPLSESRHPRDGRPTKPGTVDNDEMDWAVPWYRATDEEPHLVSSEQQYEDGDDRTRWKPSIHMPRWASRITLEVTEVRVQRLQDISEEDCVAEGLEKRLPWDDMSMQFRGLWQTVNGQREGCAWKDNPWVWAVSFKRMTA